MSKASITSVSELRRRAFGALRETWPTIFILTLTIALISWGAGQFSSIPVVNVVATILLSIPSMGVTKGLLAYLRGQELTSGCITSMFPYWTKVLCYELWSTLFIFLWMLPGLLLMGIGLVMGGFVALEVKDAGVAVLALVFIYGGLVLSLVLLIRAGLNYSMSACLLADHPDMGGIEALEESKAMMRGNRWRLVKLGLPVMLMELALIIVFGILTSRRGESWYLTLLDALVFTAMGTLAAYFEPVLYRELRGED